MNELRFETIMLKSGEFGRENPFPPIKLLWGGVGQTDFYSDRLPPEEFAYYGYGRISTLLPYSYCDGYSRNIEEREFKAAVLENNILKATFLLDFGGRLWSLVDKRTNKDLVYRNPVFQPVKIGTRSAWVSGGIEWNCGIVGHTPFTFSPVFAGRVEAGEFQMLRIYEWERIQGNPYSVDFFLPSDDSEFLYSATRTINVNPVEKPTYWWTNIAIETTKNMRVLVPAEEAITYNGFNGIAVVDTPDDRFEGDTTYPENITQALDYFFYIPDGVRRWEAAVEADGTGFIDTSSDAIRGRKLFVWGNSIGGNNWQRLLTDEQERFYCEIQSGRGKSQAECIPMKPGEEFQHLEAFGPFFSDPAKSHSKDWAVARAVGAEYLEEKLPRASFDEMEIRARALTHLPLTELKHLGSGWGALENLRRAAAGEAMFVDPAMPFPEESMGELQAPWRALLRDEREIPPEYITLPSWQVTPFWREKLIEGIWRQPYEERPFHCYQLAVIALSENQYAKALRYLESLPEIGTEIAVFANRLRAVCHNRLGHGEQAVECYCRVFAECPNELALLEEAQEVFAANGKSAEFAQILQAVTDCPDPDRLRLIRIQTALSCDDLETVEQLFASRISPAELQEGDMSISRAYLTWQTKLLARQENVSWTPEYHAEKAPSIEIPQEFEFRPRPGII